MRNVFWIAGLCSLALLCSCVADEGDETLLASDDPAGTNPETNGNTTGPHAARPADHLAETKAEAEGYPAPYAGCVHVVWCDKPRDDAWGTICQVDNHSCSWIQVTSECHRDADYVCGGVVHEVGIWGWRG